MQVDLEGMLKDALDSVFEDAHLDELVADMAEFNPSFWAQKIAPNLDKAFKEAFKREGSKLLKETIKEILVGDFDLEFEVKNILEDLVKETVREKLNALEVNLK